LGQGWRPHVFVSLLFSLISLLQTGGSWVYLGKN
jgi:hypothetical protein